MTTMELIERGIGHNCLSDAYDLGYADALDIDMDKPMHFTDEQKAWVKNYIIINAKRQKADAIDEYKNSISKKIKDMQFNTGRAWFDFDASIDRCLEIIEQEAKQLKEQTN